MHTGWHTFAALAAGAAIAVSSEIARAQWPDAPTASEVAEIARGRVVTLEHDVDSTPWPRVRLYRFIAATPEQSAAMLADYEHQRDYNVDLKEARIARRRDSASTEVFFCYASNVPFVSDVTYTVLDRIRREPDGGYTIAWTMLTGSMVKHIEGSARFAPWTNPVTGRAGTLLVYDNYVVPGFPMAKLGFVRRRGVSAMHDAVDAIAVEVERELRDDSAMMERQVAALRASPLP